MKNTAKSKIISYVFHTSNTFLERTTNATTLVYYPLATQQKENG